MSSFKKKTTTNTTQNSTATTTPNVPDWLTQPYQTAATGVGQLQTQGPGAFTPQTTPDLEKSWDAASNLQAPDYSGATGLLGGVDYDLQGASAADDMGKYRQLFDKDVTNPVMADLDVSAGKTRAAQAADAARNGAFRGARFGLREAATEGELSRARGSTYGGLLRDAANFSLTGAEGDAARRQAAQEGNRGARFTGAGLLSDITGRQQSDTRANVDMSNRIAGQKTDFLNTIRQFPIEYQKQIEGLLSGLNPDLFTGNTVNSSGTGTGTKTESASLASVLASLLAPKGGS